MRWIYRTIAAVAVAALAYRGMVLAAALGAAWYVTAAVMLRRMRAAERDVEDLEDALCAREMTISRLREERDSYQRVLDRLSIRA